MGLRKTPLRKERFGPPKVMKMGARSDTMPAGEEGSRS